MTQNTSPAVMAQRSEALDSLDDFPTPPWGTRALCEFLDGQGYRIPGQDVWEPAANRGYMVRPLAEYFRSVYATDVHDYGAGFAVRDFLFPGDEPRFDWIVTNPPFRLGQEFAKTAIERAKVGVALLLRTVWVEGGDRYRTMFDGHAPSFVLQFSGRLPMVKGRVDEKAASATSYAWFVWDVRGGPTFRRTSTLAWVPPNARRVLEKPRDYDLPEVA